MTDSELAKLMLEWEDRYVETLALQLRIADEVLKRGKTVVTGNVRATYSGGRKTQNFKQAIADAGYDSPSQLRCWRKVTYDYKKACEGLEITDIPFTQSNPSVTVKREV